MRTHKLDSPCPYCGIKNDEVSTEGGRDLPLAGDVTICVTCGEWSVFEADLSLRKPTEEEARAFVEDPRCIEIKAAWLLMDEDRRARGWLPPQSTT